ncbi:uncharacterized protein LOC106646885 [Copidosoma floridanum]|uniref:uncharacterized protein LOC106646885 n=1 Tax=Copidosoma floridanum TaxID=29053 RepID=UPI0006C969A4|nr:uncharacterized protein LOC106646885 [Copidosoma floridanum]
MAASRLFAKTRPCLLLLAVACLGIDSALGQVQLPWTNVEPSYVPRVYVQRGLNFLNDIAPNGHTYKHGSLVAAQIVMSSTNHKMYRLTFNLEPVCKGIGETCPRESCTLDAYITDSEYYQPPIVNRDSVQCHDLPAKKEQQPAGVDSLDKPTATSLDSEVQMSADHNDRPFVAVKATQSDYCPNCPYELNTSLPGLSAFGDQVLQSMDEAGVSDFKHKLISIVRVTRTVPLSSSVIRYHLLIEIGESTCLRTSHIEVSECSLQSNLPIKLCLVTFEERPWQTGSRRITKNNCTDSLLDNDNEVSASVDPSTGFSFEAPTGATSQNRDDAESTKTEIYDQIAQEAQEVFRVPSMELSTSKGAVIEELPHTRVVLVGVTGEQSEPSVKFGEDKMKEFDKFLEDFELPVKTETTSPKPDLGVPVKEEIIVKEHVEDKADNETLEASEEGQKSLKPVLLPTVESRRSKRSTKVLDNNKAGLRKLAVKVVEMIDELDEDNKKKHLVDVTGESVRESHGIVYHLTVEVEATDCREAEVSTECLDEVIPGPHQICKCVVATSEKKPLMAPKLLHYSCKYKDEPETRPRREALVGQPQAFDTNDPEIKKYVELGRQKYSQQLQGIQEPIVSQVKNVTRQVVAGYLYKIVVDIGLSTCEKGQTEKCELKADEVLKECTIEAWTRAWINNGEPEIKIKCTEGRKKRSLRGQNYSAKMLGQAKQLKEEKLFHEFISKYEKQYANDEEKEKRFKIFKENLDLIEELQRNERGTGRYGVTMFADLTKAEFKAKYLGLKPSLRSDNDIPLPMAEIPNIEIPAEYDWRHYNVVTPVKNQGQCGSCWAFSVTGNVEGQYAIKHGQLMSFSEQELIDCDKLDSGCNGGLPDTAYRAIEELGGLETETDYPYEAENEACHFSKGKAKVTIVSGLNITSNETQMAQWLVKNGPMSIGINANAMQFYIGGVSHPFHFLCSPSDLDHGVLIVGYGIKTYPIFNKTLPYWLIKNSWGPHWGERGYYRVYRGDGSCGVNQMVTSAVVA